MVGVPVWDRAQGKAFRMPFFSTSLDLLCARSFYSNKFASIEFCTVSKLRACVWVCMTRVTKVSQSSEMPKNGISVSPTQTHTHNNTIIINWTLLSMNNHPRKDDTHNTHTGKFPSYLKFYATNMPPSGWWGDFGVKETETERAVKWKMNKLKSHVLSRST